MRPKQGGMIIPDEGVHFLDGMLDLVVRVGRFDTKLKDKTINFVHH